MSSLGFFISIYILFTVAIGIYAARFVETSTDYCLAGRKLSLILCGSTMFSTWFGSETVIGASSEFLQHGFLGVIEDPFGTALCFILIGIFIAKKIYALNIVTIVDFFKINFGKEVEFIAAIFMILSYIGWIAAQFLAMAIILNVIMGIPIDTGIVVSMSVVCLYTIFGGMWSISINDFIQTIIIVFGLLVICYFVLTEHDLYRQLPSLIPKAHYRLVPNLEADELIKYITAWITIGLGSIPQQDVFQRVMSAKSQETAVKASYLSGIVYLLVGMLPLFLIAAFHHVYPSLGNLPHDQILLQAILSQDHLFIKVLFFGALLSAIMSSASGAILAPATILGENLLKPMYRTISDKHYLMILKLSVLVVSLVSGFYALVSDNVYDLVAESSIVSLVSLFVPLMAGLYWQGATRVGALLSIITGPLVWWLCIYLDIPLYGALLGLLASALSMLFGSVSTKHFKKLTV